MQATQMGPNHFFFLTAQRSCALILCHSLKELQQGVMKLWRGLLLVSGEVRLHSLKRDVDLCPLFRIQCSLVDLEGPIQSVKTSLEIREDTRGNASHNTTTGYGKRWRRRQLGKGRRHSGRAIRSSC